MLVIPAFKACMQSALIRANNKPPVELVVANLRKLSRTALDRPIFTYKRFTKHLDFLLLQYYIYCSDKKEVLIMSPRTGRPKADNSKDTMIRVRIDDETAKKLQIASEKLSISKSEIVRRGIEDEYLKTFRR